MNDCDKAYFQARDFLLQRSMVRGTFAYWNRRAG
jgi:hypothetical protein